MAATPANITLSHDCIPSRKDSEKGKRAVLLSGRKIFSRSHKETLPLSLLARTGSHVHSRPINGRGEWKYPDSLVEVIYVLLSHREVGMWLFNKFRVGLAKEGRGLVPNRQRVVFVLLHYLLFMICGWGFLGLVIH